jgi:hypothetical protein
MVQLAMTGLDAAVLRIKLREQCWEAHPAFAAKAILGVFNTALASALLIAMVALVGGHGLGPVWGGWMRYWYRRNWVLVAASFLRGLAFLRHEFSVTVWITSILNYSFFSCIALSSCDMIVLITRSAMLRLMYRLYVASLIFTAFVAYVVGSSLDHPCDKAKLSRTTEWFVINKIQASALLFHAIYFLQILVRVKVFEGVQVPIIDFGAERFSEQADLPGHRFIGLSTLENSKGETV